MMRIDEVGKNNTEIVCKIINHESASVELLPQIELRQKSIFGEVKAEELANIPKIKMEAGDEKVIAFDIPQTYFGKLFSTNSNREKRSNEISFSYFLQGTSGTIKNIHLDKSDYASGEKAKISLFWDFFLKNKEEYHNVGIGSKNIYAR